MPEPRLPRLSSLRAFEAAARLGSFREAARELAVTPSAISHQIRLLESETGLLLFRRTGRAVDLTPAGQLLAREAIEAFARISASLDQLKAGEAAQRLRISALPLFVNAWLAPRLAAFQQRHPDLSLEIETTNRVIDLKSEDTDIAIRNIYAPDARLKSRKLIDLFALPVCTPAIASALRAPHDLAGQTLIHISSRRAGWQDWLAAAGVPGLKPRSNLSFDTIPSALEAAAQGRGVMLGALPLLWEAPQSAALVLPFTGPRLSAGTYFIVHRKEDAARPAVSAFADWVARTMRADRRRLDRLSALKLASAGAP